MLTHSPIQPEGRLGPKLGLRLTRGKARSPGLHDRDPSLPLLRFLLISQRSRRVPLVNLIGRKTATSPLEQERFKQYVETCWQ